VQVTIDGKPSHEQFEFYIHPATWGVNLYGVPAGIRCVTLKCQGDVGRELSVTPLMKYVKVVREHKKEDYITFNHQALYRLSLPGKEPCWLFEAGGRGTQGWSYELSLFPADNLRPLAESCFKGWGSTDMYSTEEEPELDSKEENTSVPPAQLPAKNTTEFRELINLFVPDTGSHAFDNPLGAPTLGNWEMGAKLGSPILWTTGAVWGDLPKTQFHEKHFALARNGWVRVDMNGRPTHRQFEPDARPAIWGVNMYGWRAEVDCVTLNTWGSPQDVPNPMSVFGQHAKLMLTHPGNGQTFEGKLHRVCLPGKDPFWLAEIWRRSDGRWDCELALFQTANGYPLAYHYLACQENVTAQDPIPVATNQPHLR
jgi:hypothetical protein